MGKSLEKMVGDVNSAHSQKNDNPVSSLGPPRAHLMTVTKLSPLYLLFAAQINQIQQILNAHLSSLQWIDQNAAQLQQKLQEVTKQSKAAQIEQERILRNRQGSSM